MIVVIILDVKFIYMIVLEDSTLFIHFRSRLGEIKRLSLPVILFLLN